MYVTENFEPVTQKNGKQQYIMKSMDFFVRLGFGKITSTGAYLVYVTEWDFANNDA